MMNNFRFGLMLAVSFLITALLGCATVKEMSKGLVGVSTQVLEDKRVEALKKSFALDYQLCYSKVKDILAQKVTVDNVESSPYIYAEDAGKKMIAIYFSETDTTPVGIFFTQEATGNTLIEVSSPSTYAKEEIAKRIFSGLAPKAIKAENLADVKEKSLNQ